MSKGYSLSYRAEKELDAILDYVLKNSGPNNAIKVSKKFSKAFELLGDQPGIGQSRQELLGPSLRFWLSILTLSSTEPIPHH